MVKLTEILQAAINVLDSKFKDTVTYYTDRKEQDMKTPAIFVSIYPVFTQLETRYRQGKRIALYFDYIHDSNDQAEILAVMDTFHEIFSSVFEVADRKLFIWDKQGSFNLLNGDRFLFSFKLDFIDGIEMDKVYGYYPADYMRELHLRIDKSKEQ